MTLKLPKIAETLIRASNERNVEMYVSCFTDNAVYTDVGESEEARGKEAIAKNFEEMKYEVHSEPTHVEESPGRITMRVKASGNFQGSLLVFEYQMKVQNGLIQDLRVDFPA